MFFWGDLFLFSLLVAAIASAPAHEVLWLDCDSFPLYALDNLFEDEEYQKTGAMFWGDFGDYFNEHEVFNNPDVRSRHLNTTIFPVTSKNGFDTGILLVDKMKRQREMSMLHEITQNYTAPNHKWSKLSMGDKDMWKIAWMFAGTNYTMVPLMGAIGAFDADGGFLLSSQPKHNRQGTIIVLHQLHRGCQRAALNNFGVRHWWKLGDQPAFNMPSETIEIDMRRPMDYVNGHGWMWDGMSNELAPSQLHHTTFDLLGNIYSMGSAWDYQMKDHAPAKRHWWER
jgi:hypothetical protein